MDYARKISESLEGICFVQAKAEGLNRCELSYVTISNGYETDRIANEIEQNTGYTIQLNKLNCSYEAAISTLFSNK